jgi:hypothetical protein
METSTEELVIQFSNGTEAEQWQSKNYESESKNASDARFKLA